MVFIDVFVVDGMMGFMVNNFGGPVGFVYGFAFTGGQVEEVLEQVADRLVSGKFGVVDRELFSVEPTQEGAYGWSEDYEKYTILPLIKFSLYVNPVTGERMLLIFSEPLSKIVSTFEWSNPAPLGGFVENVDTWSGINRNGWGVAELFGTMMGFEQKPGWWHFVA